MFFAKFVQLLHPYFKHLPKGKGIVNYTRCLLEHCFSEGKFGTITDSTAKRYYYGQREKGSDAVIGDEIGSFAKDMIHLFDVSRLAKYISECTSAIAKKEDLCKTFNMISGLNADNYPTKLAEYLQTVMQQAADNYKSKKSKKAAPRISKNNAETMQQLVISIFDCVDALQDFGIHVLAELDSKRKAEWQQEYDKQYELFLQTNRKLNTFCKIYSYPPCDKILSIGILDHDAFMLKCRDGETKFIGLDPAVRLLEESLLELHQTLESSSA